MTMKLDLYGERQWRCSVPRLPDVLLERLKRSQFSYSTPARSIFYVVPVGLNGFCGVFGDGENGCYEWFTWHDPVLATSDTCYGSAEVALREVLNIAVF